MGKSFIIVPLVFGLSASSSYAQQPQPSEYLLKVTPADVDLISEGLQTQPFGKVVPLINKLRTQIMEQQPKTPEAPKVVEPPKEP